MCKRTLVQRPIGTRGDLQPYPDSYFGRWQYSWLWQALLPYRSWQRFPSDAMAWPSFSGGFVPYATLINFSHELTIASSTGLAKKFCGTAETPLRYESWSPSPLPPCRFS